MQRKRLLAALSAKAKTFSWGYKNWLGVEGQWDPETRTGQVNIVLLGALIGINLGVAVKTPAA